MHSFRRRRSARSVITLIAVMGVMLAALGWYTPQPARAQTASLLINNHLCPNPISSIDMIDLAPNCPGVGSNWSFTVTHTGGLYQQTLQTDGSGMASFGSMPAGVYKIEGATTPDFSKVAVYCNVKDGLGNDVTGWLYGYADNYYTELNIEQDGYMGYCDWWWYNPGQAPPPSSGSVMINKLDCPPGYDAANASIYDLAATCHGQGQYDFFLTDANAGNQSGSTPGGGLNTVSFSNVPSGRDARSRKMRRATTWHRASSARTRRSPARRTRRTRFRSTTSRSTRPSSRATTTCTATGSTYPARTRSTSRSSSTSARMASCRRIRAS